MDLLSKIVLLNALLNALAFMLINTTVTRRIANYEDRVDKWSKFSAITVIVWLIGFLLTHTAAQFLGMIAMIVGTTVTAAMLAVIVIGGPVAWAVNKWGPKQ